MPAHEGYGDKGLGADRRNRADGVSRRARGIGLALAILVVGAVLAGLLVATRPHEDYVAKAPPPVHVRVEAIRSGDVRPERWLSGTLRASRRAELHFELTGRVTRRLVEAGQAVDQGAPLLAIDDRDARDAVREAEARLRQEEAAIDRDRRMLEFVTSNRRLQAREVERQRRLRKGQLASGSQLELSEQKLLQLRVDEAKLASAVETAEARRTLAEVAVAKARRQLERTVLVAPFAGIVDQLALEVGDLATPSAPAVELIDSEGLDLYLEVDTTLATALARGQAITVEFGRRTVEGRIVSMAASPKTQTASYPLRIRVPGDGLIAGQVGRARLPLAVRHAALTVPVTALLYDEGRRFVFVVADGRLHRRRVETGPRIADRQVVSGPVAAGDLVVSEAVAALADGQAVVVETRPGG